MKPLAVRVASRTHSGARAENEDRVAIVSGLQPGERVVTTGQIKLNNGSRVKIDNSQELKPPAERPMQ